MTDQRGMSHRLLSLTAAALAVAAPLALADGAAAASSRAAARAQAPAELLLTFRERPGLHQFVKVVSDPASKRYRQYATVESLARRYGAAPSERRAVAAWAAAHDLELTVAPTGTFAIAAGSSRAVAGAVGARASAAGDRVPVPAALRGSVGAAALLDDAPLPLSTDADRGSGARARAAQTPAPPAGGTPTPAEILTRLFGSAAERSGTPAGCRPAVDAGELLTYRNGGVDVPLLLQGFTPNQYTTAYGHRRDAQTRLPRRGDARRGARDRRLQALRHQDVRELLRAVGAEHHAPARRHREIPGARRRDDARPRVPDGGRAEARRDRRRLLRREHDEAC